MRIKEKTHTATCYKMTDEMNGDTRRGFTANKETERKLNCNISLPTEDYDFNSGKLSCNKGLKCHSQKDLDKEDTLCPDSPNVCSEDVSPGGGRLKFFKDGKFILELSHRKDGEKTCWIPVPKKTYWPLVNSVRPENSTTLSVSDDSSSVQSSPWQRDHCWKQPTPRSNLNKDLEFYFVRTYQQPVYYSYDAIKVKRRRPFDLDTVMEPYLGKIKHKIVQKESLSTVVKLLWERVVNSCKLEPGIVSPRKRILRELERVTLEEASKRQKAKATVRSISSHSISSILAKEDDSVLRNLLRSPSPDSVRPVVPTFPTHQIQASYTPSTTSYYPQVAQSYRSQLHPSPSLWPLNYSSSSPSPTLPLYPLQTYSGNWPHSQQAVSQDSVTDVPLNLSKNAG